MNKVCAKCGASVAESQLLCTSCRRLSNQPDGTTLRARVFSPEVVDFWWVGIPSRLRRYSRLLWAAWSDGIYLTSFPRIALALPIVVLLFGFFEGATHWSPLTIDSNALNTTIPAVAFAQILHLLFIAALLGSMSANLGLMLVVGFAVGDYLVAGPFFRFGPWAPVSWFLSSRVPQLFSYWIFSFLAVAPSIAANGLLTPVRRWLPRDHTSSVLGRVAASTLVQASLVYLWIPLATVTVRVIWAWVQQTPPLAVADYTRMLNPWLPLTSGVGVVLRAVLVRVTRGDEPLIQRMKQLQQDADESDRNPAWTRRMPVWLRAVFSGAASTVLLSGLLASGWSAVVVGAGLVGVCLLRSSLLPSLAWWMKWTVTIERIPMIFRLAATTVITYYLTLALLQLPGSSPGLNPKAGQFQAELGCVGAGLLIMIVLMPFVPAAQPTLFTPERVLKFSSLPTPFTRNVSLFLVVSLLIFAGAPAYAICLDPVCCFGSPQNAALAVSCLLLVLALFAIGGAAIAGLVATAEVGEEAAALGEGAAALADTAMADTAVGGLGGGSAISPLAQTVSPLAQTVIPSIDAALADTAIPNAFSPLAQSISPLAQGVAPTVNMALGTATTGPTLAEATAVITGSATFGMGAGMAGASLIDDSGTGTSPSGNQSSPTENASAQAQLQAAQAQAQTQMQVAATQAQQQALEIQAEGEAQSAMAQAQATAGQPTSTATSPAQTAPAQPVQGLNPPQPVQGLNPPQPVQGLNPPQPVHSQTSSSSSGSSGSSHG